MGVAVNWQQGMIRPFRALPEAQADRAVVDGKVLHCSVAAMKNRADNIAADGIALGRAVTFQEVVCNGRSCRAEQWHPEGCRCRERHHLAVVMELEADPWLSQQ